MQRRHSSIAAAAGAAALLISVGMTAPPAASAATTTTITDAASCQAANGTWLTNRTCGFYSPYSDLVIAAGDTFTASNVNLAMFTLTNHGTFNLSGGDLYIAGAGHTNDGTMNFGPGGSLSSEIANTGTVNYCDAAFATAHVTGTAPVPVCADLDVSGSSVSVEPASPGFYKLTVKGVAKNLGPATATDVVLSITYGSNATSALLPGQSLTVSTSGTFAAASLPATVTVSATTSTQDPGAANNTVVLNVPQPPAMSQQPVNQSVNLGGVATFTAAATGSPTPTVQWQSSTDGGSTWSNVTGATSTTLAFTATSATNSGTQYRAVFTNTAGSVTSNAATLTVNTTPAITTQPTSQSVKVGDTADFSAAADGSPTPTVQWQVSTDGGSTWNNIPGATSTTIGFTAQISDTGKQYRAVFSNAAGSATSNPATLTVNPVDSTPPVITPNVSGTLGQNGWYVTDVTVSWTVTDLDSGITSTDGCASQTVTTDTAGITLTCTASSAGGSDSQSITIKRDASAPVLGACPAGGPYTVNTGAQSVGPIAVDAAVSGLASGTLSGTVNTSSVGTKNVSFSAIDNAGNSSSKQCGYLVAYPFTGFFQPVDNLPVLNLVKAGQSIPVKFSLAGNQGLSVLAANSPASVRISCPSSAAVDAIETTTTSNSGLTYDATSNQYTYVWKTDKTWAGTCRRFDLTLTDGKTYSVGFDFTK